MPVVFEDNKHLDLNGFAAAGAIAEACEFPDIFQRDCAPAFDAADIDTGLSERFNILYSSLLEHNDLHFMGRVMLRNYLNGFFLNRRRLFAAVREIPEILDEPIERPLFITGLPRSGTSHLHNLMACGGDTRYLRHFETNRVFFSRSRSWGRDVLGPLYSMLTLGMSSVLSPSLRAIHRFTVNGPDECTSLLMSDFASRSWSILFSTPEFKACMDTFGYGSTYCFHRAVLQMMQYGRAKKRWVLKSPCHLPALDALMERYPDALIVHIHRDPLKAVPSTCSLAMASRRIFSRPGSPERIGREITDVLATDTRRYLEFRERYRGGNVLDVYYDDLLRDPLGVAQRIHGAFDLPISKETRKRMQAYAARNSQHRYGRHRYSLEEFGLDADGLRSTFRKYTDTFAIAPE